VTETGERFFWPRHSEEGLNDDDRDAPVVTWIFVIPLFLFVIPTEA
jgi:hypothetical protein